VSALPASPIGGQLYQLLPEVYRERDKSGDLARYLQGAGELLDGLHATLAQRLDDHFPETCQDWLIPYFAELLDVAMRSPEPAGQRAEVANAIAWRQRKGTASVTETIAEAVGLMEAELQEGWRRVARTPRGAAVLAMRLDAACVFAAFPLEADGKYRLYIEPVPRLDTGDKDRDVNAMVAAYTQQLERWVRLYPDQYLWQHRRWRRRPDGTLEDQ